MKIVIDSHYNKSDNRSDGSESIIDDIESDENDLIPDNKTYTIVIDDIYYDKLRIITKGSELSFLTDINELQDVVYHDWPSICSRLGIEVRDDEWETICNILRSDHKIDNDIIKQSFNTSMQKHYKQYMSSIYYDMGYEFYRFYLDQIIKTKTTIPPIVTMLKLDRIFEQLVFYEYIYSSPIFSIYHKIRWMIDNEYYELVDMLNDNLVETTDYDGETDEIYGADDWIVLLWEYIYDETLDVILSESNQSNKLLAITHRLPIVYLID